MFESNFFTMLMKPTYERPIDTPQDIIDRGLTVVWGPGTGSLLEELKNSSSAIQRALTDLTAVPTVIFCLIEKSPF